MTQEIKGTIFCFVEVIVSSLMPILIVIGIKSMPAIGFAAVSSLMASALFLLILFFRGRIKEVFNKKARLSGLLVSLFIVVIPYSLMFIGAKYTSSTNLALLALFEIVTTMIFAHFIGEKVTKIKIISAALILAGCAMLVWKDKVSFNIGDAMIIASTFFYPVGNFYAKKALNYISPSALLAIRFSMGGIALLAVSFIFEDVGKFTTMLNYDNLLVLLLNGLLVLGISKIVWYEGLKRVDISKAISIVITYPFFSLLWLILFYNVTVSKNQLIGIGFIVIGIYFTIMRKSVPKNHTKYAS